MHPGEQHDENNDDRIEHDDESEVNTCNDDNSSAMNDSTTVLKQTVAAATKINGQR